VIGWTRGWAASRGVRVAEVNLGGGMGVDYVEPEHTFDWEVYGAALARLVAPIRPTVLRIQPGRAMTAYAGSYVTRVLDLRGGYAVVQGGTHHLPAGPDRPFRVLPVPHWDGPGSRPEVIGAPVTVVGQLGTARDVLARRVKVDRLRVGDLLVFELAGAYAWHTAAHDFLMHPPPSFHYLD